MRVVVLAEHHVQEPVVGVHHGQRVQLVFPNEVVGFLERGVGRRHDELLARRHEVRHLVVHGHAGHAVVAPGHDAQQLAVGRAVVGHRHGGVPMLLLQGHHVGQRHVGRKVGVAGHEPGLVVLHTRDHGRLLLDGLRAVDERQAAFGRQGDGHAVVGHRLHDGGNHGNVQRNGRLFAAAVLDQRRLQTHVLRDAAARRIPRNQQVLVEGTGRFVEIVGHGLLHLRSAGAVQGGSPAATTRHAPVAQVLPAIIATQPAHTRGFLRKARIWRNLRRPPSCLLCAPFASESLVTRPAFVGCDTMAGIDTSGRAAI